MPTAAGAGTGAGTTTPFGSGFAGLYASYSAFMNHLIQRSRSKTCDIHRLHRDNDRELAVPECRFEHGDFWADVWTKSVRK